MECRSTALQTDSLSAEPQGKPPASVSSIPSVLYCAHLCVKCSLNISNFLEDVSSLSHSIVFPYFFALITEEGFLISLCYSWNSAFKWVYLSFFPLPFASLLFLAICKTSSDNHVIFLYFFFLWWSWSLQCHKHTSIVLQALCLSDVVPWIYLSLPLYNHKAFDLGHTWMV